MGFNCDFDSVELRLKLLLRAEITRTVAYSITTGLYTHKTNFKNPAAPLKSTIYPRLIFGNSVALSER
mgnify:CR=1 FL=1